MLAVLTIWVAPGAVPRVSAMLAVLTIWAATWAVSRISDMLAVLSIRAAPWAVPRVLHYEMLSSASIWAASLTQYFI